MLRDGILSEARFDGLLERRSGEEAKNSSERCQDVVRRDGGECELFASEQPDT